MKEYDDLKSVKEDITLVKPISKNARKKQSTPFGLPRNMFKF